AIQPAVAGVVARKPALAVVVQAINHTRAELDQLAKGEGAAVIRGAVNDVVAVERVPPAGADVRDQTDERAAARKLDGAAGDQLPRAPDVGPAGQLADQDRIGGAVGDA